MKPYVQIGELKIASYAVMALIGIGAALLISVYMGRRYGILKKDVLCASCYGAFGMMIGAKLFYGIPFIPEMVNNLSKYGTVCGGETTGQFLARAFAGYVFYGGLLGMMAGVAFYARAMRMQVGNFMNVLAAAVPLFHGFGRIGCYLAGCCHGDGFPVQLLESACNFLLFAALMVYGKERRSPWALMAVYLMIYPVIRFVTEIFRADDIRGVWQIGGIAVSTSQIISILLFAWGVKMWKKSCVDKVCESVVE